MAGFDLVRDAHGELLVLEDNLRAPSGLAFAIALRRGLAEQLPLAGLEPVPIDAATGLLGAALEASAPSPDGDANVVLLSDGPGCSAWYEHWALAAALGIPLVTPWDLRISGDHVWIARNGTRMHVDVIYRRTDEDRLSRPDGSFTRLGELLAGPLALGNVAVANAFGTGVADDKLAHAYVEEMVRFYLGEQPLLRSVPTWDLSDSERRDEACGRLAEMVIKPRDGAGGKGVQIGAAIDGPARGRVAARIRDRPHGFVAQPAISLSTHPTVIRAELEPRRIDLRPYVISSRAGFTAVPGGLTRFAPRGSMMVNSSRGGGGKDTWVMA
jgi:carboxylate-amine ligase